MQLVPTAILFVFAYRIIAHPYTNYPREKDPDQKNKTGPKEPKAGFGDMAQCISVPRERVNTEITTLALCVANGTQMVILHIIQLLPLSKNSTIARAQITWG